MQEIGIIPVDAVYSPVVRVRYEIEETRVGQKTNYDKLTMEIWTNGSITPEMALVEAAKILRKHLNPFVQYSELGSHGAREARAAPGVGHRRGHRVEAEHEPGRAGAVGAGHQLPGIGKHHTRSATWCSRTEDQLLEVRNFGETTLNEVREKLADIGLRLGMRVPPRPAGTSIQDRHTVDRDHRHRRDRDRSP